MRIIEMYYSIIELPSQALITLHRILIVTLRVFFFLSRIFTRTDCNAAVQSRVAIQKYFSILASGQEFGSILDIFIAFYIIALLFCVATVLLFF